MVDLREVFPILVDGTTGAGEAPVSRIEGEAAAGQEGLIGFSFKDNSGNVVLPQLTTDGKIPVDTEATAGTCKYDYGTNPGSATVVDIATLDATEITVANTYTSFEMATSCLRTTLWQLVYIDDAAGVPAETTLYEWVSGPGDFHTCCKINCLTLDTTGGTGDQNIVLRGTNSAGVSTMRALLSVFELGAN